LDRISFIQKGGRGMHFRKSSGESEVQNTERSCDKHFWEWFDDLEKALGSSKRKVKVKSNN
jgi:hypothetical protein